MNFNKNNLIKRYFFRACLSAGCLLMTITGFSQSASLNMPDSAYFSALTYRNIGPTRGGRVTTVSGVASKPGTFYMGSTGGGVWKTEDYGITWDNISDGYFASPSIGSIDVYQPDPDIMYVGTGTDGLRSNVIAGKGMYKSTDAGKSWEFIGLENTGLIGAVEIHPDSPETVFVAAIGQPFEPNEDRGVFRTTDGGETWEKVFYHSDTIGVVDIEFAPGNPDIVYAALWRAERKPWTIISGGMQAGGIYKSTDGGDTWTQLKEGLPQGLIGKIDLAVSEADPNRLYALVEAPKGEGGVYRSDDQGGSFELMSTKKELIARPFYYCNIDANPLDADVVFVLAEDFLKSTDGGKSWKELDTPHGDNHDMWIHPEDTSLYIESNDGGANVTTNGGITWSSQQNQPTAELYQIEVDDNYPYWVYAGQQDNTTIGVPSLPPYDAPAGAMSFWMAVGGCETGPAVPKPGDPNIIYSNCKGRFGVFDRRTGQEQQYYVGASNIYGHDPDDLEFRFQRVAPIAVSPHDPNMVYHGSQFLHKTVDGGLTWETISPDLTANDPEKQVVSGSPITRDITGEEYYSTIYDINESPVQAGVIWVGANDGPIHVTKDGGENWTDVTPEGLGEGGRVDCVAPSPHVAGKAYAAILRYQLGDWHPYIYKTTDFGKSWALLTDGSNGIPVDYPTRVVREDPDQEGVLYAGTEYGMFVSFDDGGTWQSFQQNLPVTPITDLKIVRKDLVISTMGRSFWVLDNVASIYQLDNAKNAAKAFLYTPQDAYRYQYRGTGKNDVPYYPAPGVYIDYYLKTEPAGSIKLEILDASSNVIRSFTSATPKDESKETTDMATGFSSGTPTDDLGKTAGAHRFRWDMQHAGPWDKDPTRSFAQGPMVTPGTYQARLIIDEEEYTEPFEVLLDPRVESTEVTLADLRAQEELVLSIVALETDVKKMAAVINRRGEALDKLIEAGEDVGKYQQEEEQLGKIEANMVTEEIIYPEPKLIDQLRYLRSMLMRADQRPGKDAYTRFTELKTLWQTLETELSTFQDLNPEIRYK